MKNGRTLPSIASLVLLTQAIVGCPGSKNEEKKVSLPPPEAAAATSAPTTPETIVTMAPTVAAASQPRSDAPLAARVSGSVVASRQGQVSFKVGGHVAKMHVEVGTSVRRGQVLAELDPTDFQLRERLASAGAAQARTQFEQAQRDLAREEQLRRENATSAASIERMNTAFAGARAGLETAQINLETAKKAVSDTKLVAPFNGVVTKKMKAEGEFVGMGASVYEIADTTDLEISLKAPEALMRRVRVGQNLTISSPGTDVKVPVRVVRIVPVVSESTRTFEIVCAPTRGGTSLYPGQYVETDLN